MTLRAVAGSSGSGGGVQTVTGNLVNTTDPLNPVISVTRGTAAMVSGTVTIIQAAVTANSIIFIDAQIPGGTPGWYHISARVPGTSFTVVSSSATDSSTIGYVIFEPA